MDVIDTACMYNATAEMVVESLRCQGFPCSVDTLERLIREKHNVTFAEYRNKKTGAIKLRLIQKAVDMALNGHPTMLIFSLKNLCDWRDRPKEDLSLEELVELARQQLSKLGPKKDEPRRIESAVHSSVRPGWATETQDPDSGGGVPEDRGAVEGSGHEE